MVKSLLLGCSSIETIIKRSGPKFGPGYIPIIVEGNGGLTRIEGCEGWNIGTEKSGLDGGTAL